MNSHTIELGHGGGGVQMNRLIQEVFFAAFGNELLQREEDAAILPLPSGAQSTMAFTTDSFTVTPLIFNGGDIGKLAIAGTVNDLAMMGAKPQYLSCSFIIEEGLPLATLKAVAQSMAKELAISGAHIVCGDTKVVPRGCADQLFINTTGIGLVQKPGLSASNVADGDAIIVSRDVGCHGATILMNREGLELGSALASDCATLWPVVEALIAADLDIHALRDATRGGLAAVVNEWAQASAVAIELNEAAIPVCDEVRGLCELYGMEPFQLANEGTFILALPAAQAEQALTIMRQFSPSTNAAIIGRASHSEQQAGTVVLQTPWGSQRYLEVPPGELLPRIC